MTGSTVQINARTQKTEKYINKQYNRTSRPSTE